MNWVTAAPVVGSAFLASLVEAVEAFTIVLAVASVRGWRIALSGAAAGLVILAVIILAAGPLLDRVPLSALRFVIGVLLLLFGLRWLRKAILRMAGLVALHDEQAAFAKETAVLKGAPRAGLEDWVAGIAALKAVVVEGIEVVFIVIALGSGNGLLPAAALGAAAACLLVAAAGAALRSPLARVPENALKLVVGVALSSFGVFWTGEGLSVDWPLADGIIPVFAVMFLAAAFALAAVARRNNRVPAA
jgi:uncharacterized membrane protein